MSGYVVSPRERGKANFYKKERGERQTFDKNERGESIRLGNIYAYDMVLALTPI